MARIHLISIGGAVMHNIALALQETGHVVSGSDDEIYEPSRSRLERAGLLPTEVGWHPERIGTDTDLVILGMHAREGNPEILRARQLGIPVWSFPEYIFQHARDKKRVVVAGSHGKTTTTSMIMHAMKKGGYDFDYLVGGQIDGFENMVRFSDAPLIILEGDEYLSSTLDLRPKMLWYRPHLAVITGIAWDHMNVFPTFEQYKQQFDLFIDTVEKDGKVFCFGKDMEVQDLMARCMGRSNLIAYQMIPESRMQSMKVFGPHNRANMEAARLVCMELGMEETAFYHYMESFTGTSKRLQKLVDRAGLKVFLDFAHAPSKLKATIEATRLQYPDYQLIALYELHTYSSLNKDFIQEYRGTMDLADQAVVFFNKHTLEMKKMPPLDRLFVRDAFSRDTLHVFNKREELELFLRDQGKDNVVYLFMTSGNFEKLDLRTFFD